MNVLQKRNHDGFDIDAIRTLIQETYEIDSTSYKVQIQNIDETDETLKLTLFLNSSVNEEKACSYHVDSLGCTISCPLDIEAVYIGMPSSQLESLGLSKQSVDEFLETNGLEFIAYVEDYSYELHVVKYPAPLSSRLKDQSAAFLKGFMITFIPSTEKNLGAKITSSEVVETADNVYIRFEFSIEDKGEEDVITYYTYSDGYAYEFYFYCGQTVEEHEEKWTREIMNSVLWD